MHVELDEELQVGIRAAMMLLEQDPSARAGVQECMLKVRNALNMYEAHLTEANESDFIWKSELIDSIPPFVSSTQLRAILVLLKARPFLVV